MPYTTLFRSGYWHSARRHDGIDGHGGSGDVDYGKPGTPRSADHGVRRGQDGTAAGAHLRRRPEQHDSVSVGEQWRHRARDWRKLQPGGAGRRLYRLSGSERQYSLHRCGTMQRGAACDLVLQARLANLVAGREPQTDDGHGDREDERCRRAAFAIDRVLVQDQLPDWMLKS